MEFDYEKAGVYPAAYRAFRANWQAMVIVAIAFVFLDAIEPTKFSSAASDLLVPIGLSFFVAFLIHRTIIHGPAKNWQKKSEGDDTQKGFYWRSVIIVGIFIVLVAIPFAISMLIFGSAANPLEEKLNAAMFFGFIIGLPFYGVFLSLWGTILPATVARDDASFKAAYQKGRPNFWYTYGRMIIGPVLVVVLFVVAINTVAKIGVPVSVYQDGQFDPVGSIIAGLLHFVSLFTTALAATVLCKTYLRAKSQ